MKITGEEKHKHCLNCGSSFKGNFCPNCGQKAGVKRLKITEIVMDMANSLVGGDNKFYCTCRDLSCRPGHMVRNYLLGKRAKYYNPLQLFVFTLTIFAVVAFIIGEHSTILDDIITWELDMDDIEEAEYASIVNTMNHINKLLGHKLYGALIIAFLSIFPCRLLFCKDKILRPDGASLPMNLTEHFYAQMFHSCIQMIASIILLPVCLIDGSDNVLHALHSFIAIFYSIIMYKQILGIGWIKSTLLNLIALVITLVTAFFLIIAIIVVGELIK